MTEEKENRRIQSSREEIGKEEDLMAPAELIRTSEKDDRVKFVERNIQSEPVQYIRVVQLIKDGN